MYLIIAQQLYNKIKKYNILIINLFAIASLQYKGYDLVDDYFWLRDKNKTKICGDI